MKEKAVLLDVIVLPNDIPQLNEEGLILYYGLVSRKPQYATSLP
jgi:hypothetical protein